MSDIYSYGFEEWDSLRDRPGISPKPKCKTEEEAEDYLLAVELDKEGK